MVGCLLIAVCLMRSSLLWWCGRPTGLSSLRPRLRSFVGRWGKTAGTRRSRPRRTPRSSSPLPGRCGTRAGASRAVSQGHPGSTLALVANPDERLRHEPGPCTGCGADLTDAPEVGAERRQVFDLPPMTVRVTEHQLIARRCRCGTTTCGTAPEGVTAPARSGPRITAIILYLYVGQFLSKKRTAAALAELFATPVFEGTVATMTKRAVDGLDDFLTQVGDRIAASEVAGFDETGLRVAGTLHWVTIRVNGNGSSPRTWFDYVLLTTVLLVRRASAALICGLASSRK